MFVFNIGLKHLCIATLCIFQNFIAVTAGGSEYRMSFFFKSLFVTDISGCTAFNGEPGLAVSFLLEFFSYESLHSRKDPFREEGSSFG